METEENPLLTRVETGREPRSPPVIAVTRNEEEQTQIIPDSVPVLPLRNMVIFPGTVVPLTVGRASSRRLLQESLTQSKVIGVFTQRNAEQNDPAAADLYQVGTAGLVLKLIRQSEEATLIVVQALRRIKITRVVETQPFIRAEIEVLHSRLPSESDRQWDATVSTLRESALQLIGLAPEAPMDANVLLNNIEDPGTLADFLAGSMSMDVLQKRDLLEELDVVKRVRAVQVRVSAQLEIAHLQQKIQKDVQSQFTDAQRRAYLHEQVRAIQKELGEELAGSQAQIEQLRRRLDDSQPPTEVMEHAEKELGRLNLVPPASPEFSVIIGYIETLADLPWSKLSPDNLDLNEAQRILDRDHYNLAKVKRRLIEYLAVRKLNPQGRGPILCFLGPPGVGKTSLGQSIADALGRKFSRMSLGGIRDEAEIRGHRRTYIGAMPGRIIQELRRVGTRNPVIMLDEVDKIGADFRGDPASALLEVLDPRQNNTFVDRFLDVPFDLSQVIFIATSNYMDPVPPALRDRMEVIEIPGYTEKEKLHIAIKYLLQRQLKENGIKPEQCAFHDDALEKIIADYTHEAGVRELERQIASICRAVAARIARGECETVTITPEQVQEILGPQKYIRETRLKTGKPGVVTGLAFTPTGGEILHIEATRYPGRGNIMLTGHIGDVMRESAQAAISLVRTRVNELGISPDAFKDTDIHIHVPSGAVPKDGPSAGIAMFTAVASLFTNTPVRSDAAMTGEISLRGLVLPIGGLKEKALAAARAGIENVIIPKLNEKDLPELPEEVKQKLKFTATETVDEVLGASLEKTSDTEGLRA
ncbi:MAG TPA: endopeptidase La [Verrucomicrobiae bacterium]|jgi:ATP-dependent Lon protease|nr:endopeptidase La [Verrucomicrobiae bacterium]